MPKLRAAMHLDTVFTFADCDCVLLYPDIVDKIECFSYRPDGKGGITLSKDKGLVETVKEALGLKQIRVAETGGNDYMRERTQWDSGANLVCASPGVVFAYDRNSYANTLLRKAGIFSLPQTFGRVTCGLGALIARGIAGAGMLMLAFVFRSLSRRRPELDAGVYAKADIFALNFYGGLKFLLLSLVICAPNCCCSPSPRVGRCWRSTGWRPAASACEGRRRIAEDGEQVRAQLRRAADRPVGAGEVAIFVERAGPAASLADQQQPGETVPGVHLRLVIGGEPAAGDMSEAERAGAAAHEHAACIEEPLDHRGDMGRRHAETGTDRGQAVLKVGAGVDMDRLAVEAGAFAGDGGEQLIGIRVEDEAGHGPPVLHQRQRDAPVALAVHEAAGAVDGIEHPEKSRTGGGGAEFLAEEAVAGKRLVNTGAHQLLDLAVGDAHHILPIGLGLDGQRRHPREIGERQRSGVGQQRACKREPRGKGRGTGHEGTPGSEEVVARAT